MESDATVQSVITREYVGVSESDSVLEVVKLMRTEQSSAAVALRGEDPVGIVTEWDVMGVVADEADPAETAVSDVMSSPVQTVSADTSLVDAANAMSSEGIRNLVVENGPTGELLGVLSDRDVIAAVGSLLPAGGPADVGSPAGTARAPTGGNVDAVEATETGTPGVETDVYSTQGVCEACGTLTDALREVNGQLVCADCREM